MKKAIYCLALALSIVTLSSCGSKVSYERPEGHPSTCSCMDCSLALK